MELPEARRCIASIAAYLRERDDSPRAAADLAQAVKVIEEHARLAAAPPLGLTPRQVAIIGACEVDSRRQKWAAHLEALSAHTRMRKSENSEE